MSVRLEHTAHRILFALVRARRARRRTSRSSRGRTVMMVRSPLAGPLAIIVAVILLANLARVYAPRAHGFLCRFPSQRALSRAFVGRADGLRAASVTDARASRGSCQCAASATDARARSGAAAATSQCAASATDARARSSSQCTASATDARAHRAWASDVHSRSASVAI